MLEAEKHSREPDQAGIFWLTVYSTAFEDPDSAVDDRDSDIAVRPAIASSYHTTAQTPNASVHQFPSACAIATAAAASGQFRDSCNDSVQSYDLGDYPERRALRWGVGNSAFSS